MKHSVLFVASLAALSLAGCKKTETPDGNVAASTAAADATAMPTPIATVNADQAFADAAAASDAFEIQTSQLAVSKAKTAKVKTFAEAMIKAHTQSTDKLKTAAAAASPAIAPQAQLTPMQQQTLEALTAQSGTEFETTYKKAQAEGHQMTLDKLKAYSANGAQASLKAFATEMVPIVTAHLNMAKGL
jgi:putative membrane protein